MTDGKHRQIREQENLQNVYESNTNVKPDQNDNYMQNNKLETERHNTTHFVRCVIASKRVYVVYVKCVPSHEGGAQG